MVDDVTVGEVTEVDRVGWHAEITMRVRDGTELPDNAIADIRQSSLLGEKYVALEAPTEPRSRPASSATATTSRSRSTGRNPEVEEVLGALSFLLSGGGVGQLGTITHELNKVMSGRTERLRHLLGSLESVIGTLDAQRAEIISALESMNGLAKTLNAERETIGEALDAMGPAVEVLAAQHDELIEMLGALDRLGVVGTRVIGASKDDLIATLADLQPVLTKLHEAGDKLAPGLDLMVSFPFPKEAAEVVKGDYANASIRAGINLEILLPPTATRQPDPAIPLPDPGEVLTDVQKCLESGDLDQQGLPEGARRRSTSTRSSRSTARSREERGQPGLPGPQPAARRPAALPDLPDLPGLPGLLQFSDALASGRPSPAYTGAGLYAGVRHDARHQGPDRGLPRAERGRHRLHRRQLPRARRQGPRPRLHRARDPARRPAACSRAAR